MTQHILLGQTAMIRETTHNPIALSQALQACVGMLNAKVCHRTVIKRLNKYGLF